MPARDNSKWMSLLAGEEVEAPVITSLEELVAFRSHPSRDFRRHNFDLPEVAELHESVILRERGGLELTAEIYVPKGESPFPSFLLLHGGGWSWARAEYVRKLGMRIAERGFLVVNLEYGLAPEHPFPWAVEDTVYALRWITANAVRYGGDGSSIGIGGGSAGANLAAAAIVALTADEELVDGGDLAGQSVSFSAAVLMNGIFDFPLVMQEPGSYAGMAEVMFNLSYLGPNYLRHHRNPLVSPIYSPSLERFPSTYLACGAEDSLLGQSLAMTKALTQASVPTTLSVIEGLDHAWSYVPHKLPEAERELQRIFDWLVRHTRVEQPISDQ